jgi:hypothetical protein
MAVGWILREMRHGYGAEITNFLEGHAEKMGTPALFDRITHHAHILALVGESFRF